MRRRAATALDELAGIIASGAPVVFITGAGTSQASGIPTFRGASDSVWSVTSTAKGRRAAFLRDPKEWYNSFWLRYFTHDFTRRRPNAAHEAIAAVHGRLGLYKCVNARDGCRYASDDAIAADALLPAGVGGAINAHGGGRDGELAAAPACPGCGQPVPPMALMFDENYESHAFYRFAEVLEWMDAAAAFVFVGTSFAVTVTSLALDEARRRRLPIFDFDLRPSLTSTPVLDVRNIDGPAEATLPLLAARLNLLMAASATAAGAAADSEAASPVPPPPPSARAQRSDGTALLSGDVREGGDRGCNDDDDDCSFGAISSTALPQNKRMRDSYSGHDAKAVKSEGNSSGGRGSSGGDGSGGSNGGSSSYGTGEGASTIRHFERVGFTLGSDGRIIDTTCSSGGDGPGSGGSGALQPSRRIVETRLRYDLAPILPTPLPRSAVRAELSSRHRRRVHPDPSLEQDVLRLWEQEIRTGFSDFPLGSLTLVSSPLSPNPLPLFHVGTFDLSQLRRSPIIFNGTKFRLAGMTYSTGRGGNPELTLRLALTDYRDFRGTNWSPQAACLVSDGLRDRSDGGVYLSQKLGVGAVLELSDGNVLLIRRSKHVAEGKGAVDVPGGHPEPKKLGLTAESFLGGAGGSHRTELQKGCVDEIFDSILEEVVDETNVPRAALSDPLLLGVVMQRNSAGAPSAAFLVRCALPAAAVLRHYQEGPREAFETTAVLVVHAEELAASGAEKWFQAKGLEPTPSCEGAIELW
ncbi:unnamed protein product, partial [Phaeothamnion confervicola]